MKMARVEAAMRAALAFYEAFNRHDADGMMALVSEDCIFENNAPAPDGHVYAGKEAVTRFWQDYFQERSQAQIEIEEVFGLCMRCVARWRQEWVDAAGKREAVRGVDILRVTNGFISELFSYSKGMQ